MLFPLAPIPGLESAATIRWICTISCGEKFAKFGGDGTSMDVLRSRKRVTLIPPEALDAGSYEDPLPSDGTLAQRVDALPPEVGTIIKLRFYEDLSLKEISTVTGWNLNTVKTRLYTGLKKLRISMEGDQL